MNGLICQEAYPLIQQVFGNTKIKEALNSSHLNESRILRHIRRQKKMLIEFILIALLLINKQEHFIILPMTLRHIKHKPKFKCESKELRKNFQL